jgi:hypothetical protein
MDQDKLPTRMGLPNIPELLANPVPLLFIFPLIIMKTAGEWLFFKTGCLLNRILFLLILFILF